MQQQTIGEVANSITFSWADTVCLQQCMKELLKSDSTAFVKKGQVFLTHSVYTDSNACGARLYVTWTINIVFSTFLQEQCI